MAYAEIHAAREKLYAVEDEMCGLLSSREKRRVDWLRLDLNKCREKVGAALDNKRGWEKQWDETNKQWKTVLPYTKLPFLWRVVAYFFTDADSRKEVRPGQFVYRYYWFRKEHIERVTHN